jgi:aryl-phospho-beta-D-glucosidase BglC (GH1 family)
MKLQLSLILLVILCVVHAVINGSNQNVTRFRGTMISTTLTADDFRVLASWKANHIRWQLHCGHQADNATVAEYETWLESALKQFDAMIPVCRELGLNVLLDLHTPPGGRDPKQNIVRFLFGM